MSGTYILGIDPGHANFAYAVLDAVTQELVSSDRVAVREWDGTDASVARSLGALARELTGRFAFVGAAIELQTMSQTLRGCQQAMAGALEALGVPVRIVAAQTVKSHFREHLGFRGHRRNKADALAFVRPLYPAVRSDHVADAIILALFLASEI